MNQEKSQLEWEKIADVNINKYWNYVTKSSTMRLIQQVILDFLMKVKINTEDFSKVEVFKKEPNGNYGT